MTILEQRLESLRKLRALELRRRELAQQDILENLGTSRYRSLARPQQLPPDGDWRIWLLETGRGFGKTFSGAGWVTESALSEPESEWAIVAPTFTDVRRVCVEGPSGALKMFRRGELDSYNRSTGELHLINGSRIQMISAEKPDRTRGLNLSGVWCDEFSSWQYQEEMWNEVLLPALRKGRGKTVITTTPYGSTILRGFKARNDGSVVVTRGSIDDNAANLSPEALADMHARLDDTRVGRRELYGEDLYDIPGAMWKYEDILIQEAPAMKRIVIAVDPAVTVSETSDETGIIVAGKGVDNNLYVLGDYSCKETAFGWATIVNNLFQEFDASMVIYEQNQGGTVHGEVLMQVNPYIPNKPIPAADSKQGRAAPVAALYERHLVFHVKHFQQLEDQYCTWDPESKKNSPDRLDAAVHALRDLADIGAGSRFLLDLASICGNCRQPNSKDATMCFSCHEPLDG